MSNINEKILKALENLQTDVTALRAGQVNLQTQIMVLQGGQKTLESGQQTLDLKVEAIHAYQKQAHDEIMGHMLDIAEVSGHDHKTLVKRVERIEKHLDLPPLK